MPAKRSQEEGELHSIQAHKKTRMDAEEEVEWTPLLLQELEQHFEVHLDQLSELQRLEELRRGAEGAPGSPGRVHLTSYLEELKGW